MTIKNFVVSLQRLINKNVTTMKTMNLFADSWEGVEPNAMKKLRDAFMALHNAYNSNKPYLEDEFTEVKNAIERLDYYLYS